MNMNISRIRIRHKDKNKYGLIAYLVDKDEFLKDISDIRESLGLLALPYSFPRSKDEEFNKTVGYFDQGKFTIYEVWIWIVDYCAQKGMYPASLDSTLSSAAGYAEGLTKKYGKSNSFIPVILSSILTGVVSWRELSSTHIHELNQETLRQMLDNFDDSENRFVIEITPESSPEEVKQSLLFVNKFYLKDKLPDTISNIRRDRKWYWQHKEGMSYRRVWQNASAKGEHISMQGVIEAIKQYRLRLL